MKGASSFCQRLARRASGGILRYPRASRGAWSKKPPRAPFDGSTELAEVELRVPAPAQSTEFSWRGPRKSDNSMTHPATNCGRPTGEQRRALAEPDAFWLRCRPSTAVKPTAQGENSGLPPAVVPRLLNIRHLSRVVTRDVPPTQSGHTKDGTHPRRPRCGEGWLPSLYKTLINRPKFLPSTPAAAAECAPALVPPPSRRR